MRHEDVSKKIMLAGLNRTLDEWLCYSFVELIEEMELWKWDDATGDFWSRLMMMIAFITIKSSLVPLIEGLCAQIQELRFEILGGLR